jgi:hypothetical protein
MTFALPSLQEATLIYSSASFTSQSMASGRTKQTDQMDRSSVLDLKNFNPDLATAGAHRGICPYIFQVTQRRTARMSQAARCARASQVEKHIKKVGKIL